MAAEKGKRICLVPRLSGVGGMVSFAGKLAKGLVQRGIEPCYDLQNGHYEAVLVIGGTRNLLPLWQARQKGIPIVQRLDGINWIHRVQQTGLRHYLRAEYGNYLLNFIRTRIANRVVYQSHFAQNWWERLYDATIRPSTVIYNGIDLNVFSPEGPDKRPDDRVRLLLVEGSLMGGYEAGLSNALGLGVEVLQQLNVAHSQYSKVEILVVGRVLPEVQRRVNYEASAYSNLSFHWSGLIPLDQIPMVDRSAHVLYSSDVHAACPNAVIEALACGTPVVAFDTGALPELVDSQAGRIVPYGRDPWKLEKPDLPALARAVIEILKDQERFRSAARDRAIALFSLDTMVDRYLQVLLE